MSFCRPTRGCRRWWQRKMGQPCFESALQGQPLAALDGEEIAYNLNGVGMNVNSSVVSELVRAHIALASELTYRIAMIRRRLSRN